MSSKITIYLAEEDDVIRLGHRHIIEKSPQFELVGESDRVEEIVDAVQTLKPCIVVLSWTLSAQIIDLARNLLRAPERPHILLVLSSAHDFFPALRTYSRGYILKQTQSWVLPVAMDALGRGACFIEPFIAGYLLEGEGRFQLNAAAPGNEHNGGNEPALTPKEIKVMHLLCDGLSNPEIAANLRISVETVRVHLKNIYRKLGVTRRDDAIAKMKQLVTTRRSVSVVNSLPRTSGSERPT